MADRAGRNGRRLAALLGAALLAATAALGQGMGGGGGSGTGQGGGASQGPREVGVVTLASERIPYTLTLPGRAVAYEEADIRPRVSGAIEEVAYEPGQPVKAGDLLFRIEDESYRAAVAAAEATVASAQAGVATAEATVSRYRTLQGTAAVARADLETAEAALSQARAQLASAQAELTAARLDLDRTEIRSPIAGLPGVPEVSRGEIVTANQADALAIVTRLDPIYVDVAESSARLTRIRDRIEQGSLAPGDTLGFRLQEELGGFLEGEGTLVTPGTTVSTTTGTVDFRIRFGNPDRRVLPGQFLRVEVTLGTSEGIMVPQRATSRAPNGALTAFVARDGVAHEVTLTSTGTFDNGWIVTDGVAPGDQLIVDGLNNLRDGAEVAPTPVEIDDQGVVRDVPAANGASTAEGAAPTATPAASPPPAVEGTSAAGEPATKAGASGSAASE